MMTTETESPPCSEEPELVLPDLQDVVLSEARLSVYLDELAATVTGVQFTLKRSVRERPQSGGGVADLKPQLLSGAARSAQLRYRYQGVSWVDTVIAQSGGFRLVRMQLP